MKELLALAIPAALSVVLNNAYRVIDQFSVQWLGTAAQAAVSSFTFVLILCFAFYGVVAIGVGPLIARATGADDISQRRRLVGTSLTSATLLGVIVWLSAGVFAEQLTWAVGLTGEAASEATTYMRWLALCGLSLSVAPVVDSAFISMGKTVTPMLLQLVATLGNGLFNWLFIYELEQGIAGAAMATGLSRLLSVVIGLVLLHRHVKFTWSDLIPNLSPLIRILRVGIPIAANTGAYALVYWGVLKLAISPLGPEVNAGLGIGFSALEGFTWPCFHGISLAVASVIGRRLGANDREGAMQAAKLGLPMTSAAGFAAAVIFWFGGEALCSLYTEDPAVLREAITYAHVLAFSQIFVAYEALAEGILEGSGDTNSVLYWSLPFNIMRIPLCWFLAGPMGFGAAGVWWAINCSTFIKALGKGYAVFTGRWLYLKI